MFFGWEGPEREWGWVGAYLSLSLSLRRREVGLGWALIRGWVLIKFFCLQDGCLFEVGANSRLGAYSNKFGISFSTYLRLQQRKVIGLACHEGSHAGFGSLFFSQE